MTFRLKDLNEDVKTTDVFKDDLQSEVAEALYDELLKDDMAEFRQRCALGSLASSAAVVADSEHCDCACARFRVVEITAVSGDTIEVSLVIDVAKESVRSLWSDLRANQRVTPGESALAPHRQDQADA